MKVAVREFGLRLAAVLVLCMVVACAPLSKLGEVGGAGIPPIVGRVDMGSFYSVAASMGDIGNGATVSLIDTTSNISMSSTVSSPGGEFSLSFPSSFVPTTNAYYLEAVKGLSQHRPGNPAARVRTIIQFVQGQWAYMTAGLLTINRASTALSLIVGHRFGTPDQVDAGTLIDSLGTTGDPPIFQPGASGISQADYATILGYVTRSLTADRDPLAAITYNTTSKSYTYTDTTSPQILIMSPTVVTGGSTIYLTGQNFSSTPAANTVSFAGTTGTVTAASVTQLTVVAPVVVVPGTLTVTTAIGASNGVPYTVIKGVNGTLNP